MKNPFLVDWLDIMREKDSACLHTNPSST